MICIPPGAAIDSMAARTPAAAMSSSVRDASHVGSGLSSPGEWAAIVSHQNSYDLQSS